MDFCSLYRSSLAFLWLSELFRPSGGPRASSAAVAVWTDCAHTPNTNTHMHKHMKNTVSCCETTHTLSPPLFHPSLISFPAPLSFSLPSLHFQLCETAQEYKSEQTGYKYPPAHPRLLGSLFDLKSPRSFYKLNRLLSGLCFLNKPCFGG